jgi:uncharacterized protein (TIGR02466 family)
MNILDIFPTPIAISQFNRKFTDNEMDFFISEEATAIKNCGNLMGKNQYVLELELLADIKSFIEGSLNTFLQNVYRPQNNITAHVTQSWISYVKDGQEFHRHVHQNSIVSGCLYINADRSKDKINFYKNDYQQILIPTKQNNQYNTGMASVPVGSYDLVLFPSKLYHAVPEYNNSNTRISLAFNSFIKGKLSDGFNLLDLELN